MHLAIIPDNVKHLTRKTWSTWKNYQSLDCTVKLKSHNGPRKQLMLGGQKTQGRQGTTTLLKVFLCAEEVSNRSNELNKGAIGRAKMKNGKTKKEKPCTGYEEEGRMVQAVRIGCKDTKTFWDRCLGSGAFSTVFNWHFASFTWEC